MKFKFSYIIGIFIFILSMFFFNAYLQNHTYYFDMMQNVKHLYEILAGLLCAVIFVFILLNFKRNISFLIKVFIGLFLLFSIILTALRGGLVSLPIIVVNYLIVLFYVFVIFLGALALGNMLMKKLNFKESIYNFSIKFGLGFAILSLITYFLTIFGFINVYVSYLLFFALFYVIYKNRDFIKDLFSNLSDDLNNFIENISKHLSTKVLFSIVVVVICLYFYFGFNYAFIPYPSAWDASHAYIYYPMVFSNYNGYPWSTDFRPGIILWSTVLTWAGQLGYWIWFSKDTWMITFNYFSGVLTIIFGFMLINILVKFTYREKDFKHSLLLILGYILLLTWLSSGMGAFLLFVDNKTDIATLMYIILGIFLAIYFLERVKEYFEEIKNIEEIEYGVQKEKNNGKMKLLYVFIALSGFFFAIANLIKPTATFDFFETTIVLSVLNIGIFIVIGIILFVLGLLAYLKFRGFDKAVDPKYSMSLIGGGIIAMIFDIVLNLLKKAKKFVFIFVSLLVFVGTFLLTLIVTKGTFGLLQIYHDKNVDTSAIKLTTSIVMGNSFPTIAKNEFTGSLYSGLKKEIGSSYNEDNGRYVGYGEHNFHQVWWDIFIPSNITYKHCLKKNDYNQCIESETKKLKSTYCLKFNPNIKEKCKVNDLEVRPYVVFDFMKEKAIEIFNNRDNDIIDKELIYKINEKSIKLFLSGLVKTFKSNKDINLNLSYTIGLFYSPDLLNNKNVQDDINKFLLLIKNNISSLSNEQLISLLYNKIKQLDEKHWLNTKYINTVTKDNIRLFALNFVKNIGNLSDEEVFSLVHKKLKQLYEYNLKKEIDKKFMINHDFDILHYDKALQTEKNKLFLTKLNTENIYYNYNGTKYCLKFNSNIVDKCKEGTVKIDVNLLLYVLKEKAWEFFENRDENYTDKYALSVMSKYDINELAKKMGIDSSKVVSYKLKSIVYSKMKEGYENSLLNEIKDKFMKGDFNLSTYNKALQTEKNKKLLEQLNTKNVYYTEVAIPYTRLVPFNVTFNWSLQNKSSYYTDMGIMWLVLLILVVFAFVYSILLFVYALIKKDDEKIQDSKLMFAFSFATLVGWIIWNFVASGIVWYNIGGIMWLIITTLVYVSKLKDRNILIYVLLSFSILSILFNFIRISNQGGGKYLYFYKNSAGEKVDYKLTPNSFKTDKITKIPYKKQDLFDLQFGLYNRIIKFLDKREKGEKVVIGGTYMKYFLKNQDGIVDDQFLTYLWKLGSDENINKFYKRLKDKKIKYIVLDPSIAGVVQGKGNIEIWYRYFGKVDKNGNMIEKGVFPHLVDLANDGKIEYKFSTNLAKKYALIYTDEQMGKILGIKDLKQVREIKYEMIVLPHIKVDLAFINKSLAEKLTQRAYSAYSTIFAYRVNLALSKKSFIEFASDLADMNGLNIDDVLSSLSKQDFTQLTDDEKQLRIMLFSNLYAISQDKSKLNNLIKQGISSHIKVLFVEVK